MEARPATARPVAVRDQLCLSQAVLTMARPLRSVSMRAPRHSRTPGAIRLRQKMFRRSRAVHTWGGDQSGACVRRGHSASSMPSRPSRTPAILRWSWCSTRRSTPPGCRWSPWSSTSSKPPSYSDATMMHGTCAGSPRCTRCASAGTPPRPRRMCCGPRPRVGRAKEGERRTTARGQGLGRLWHAEELQLGDGIRRRVGENRLR
jgi:hypothetical protein